MANPNPVLPPGRKRGVPNKATAQAREAIASFVDGNADRLTGWLDTIANDDPKDAFNCFMSVVEYHIPKLQRAIVSGDPDNPIVHQHSTVGNFLASVPESVKAKLREALDKAADEKP